MAKYRLYIAAPYYKPEFRPPKLVACENVGWTYEIDANGGIDALEKCLPQIRAELPKLQGKYVSVNVGEMGSTKARASRLQPIQVVIETGEIRETHLTQSYLMAKR